MYPLSRAHRRQRRARRVFVRPFLAADCRQDFDTLQGRLLDRFVPLGTVDTSAFEQTMTLLWKWNFRKKKSSRHLAEQSHNYRGHEGSRRSTKQGLCFVSFAVMALEPWS